jgi:TfoX/Sxy family transcriptional regulator of competence genes
VAYDERLAARVRDLLAGDPGLSERKMFGGLAFMHDGNMCCGIVGDRLMLRLGAELAEQALKQTHVHPMDFTGRPMTGMVYVAPQGLRGNALRAGSNRPPASHEHCRPNPPGIRRPQQWTAQVV